jgi:hypothetical protein
MAAKCGNKEAVSMLLGYGADVTLQNDGQESAFSVASPEVQELMIKCARTGAKSRDQRLLNASWFGDAVTVRECLTGEQYIDVNCKNSEGLTPLLLVTKDTELFEKVHSSMQEGYNPVEAMQEILEQHADVNMCDNQGRSPIHMIADNCSVHATRMVSLLLSHGSDVDSEDSSQCTPLHHATHRGNMAIIVALVEEGGANVNKPSGGRGDTPLMVSAREGQCQTAKYLLSKGADINAVNEDGDTALTVAKTTSMVHLLKEAWTEASQEKRHAPSPTPSPNMDEGLVSTSSRQSLQGEEFDSESDVYTPMATVAMAREKALHLSQEESVEGTPTNRHAFITQQSQLHFRSLSDPAIVTQTAEKIQKEKKRNLSSGEIPIEPPVSPLPRPHSQNMKLRDRKQLGEPPRARGRTRSLADINTHGSRLHRSQTRLPVLERPDGRPHLQEDRLHPLEDGVHQLENGLHPQDDKPRPQENSLHPQLQEDRLHPHHINVHRKTKKIKHGSMENVTMATRIDDGSSHRFLPEVKVSKPSGPRARPRAFSTGEAMISRRTRSKETLNPEQHGKVLPLTEQQGKKQGPSKKQTKRTSPSDRERKGKSPSKQGLLPVLPTNAKPIAMVAVEMDKEVMYYHKWPDQQPSPDGEPKGLSKTRSTSNLGYKHDVSCIATRSAGSRPRLQHRSSTGSIGMLRGTSIFPAHLGEGSKEPVNLPSLSGAKSVPSSSDSTPSPVGKTTPTRPHPPPSHQTHTPATPLSAVVEVRETLTPSPHTDRKSQLESSSSNLSGAQTSSTVISCGFSSDSLESSVVKAHSLEALPKEEDPVISHPSLNIPPPDNKSSVPTLPEVAKATSIIAIPPPTPIKIGNIVINYPAIREGDSPLSPIWYLQQQQSTDSDSGSPDYITSNLGRRTPIPKLRAPESPSNRARQDSGQGESDSDKLCEESDDSTGNEAIDMEANEVLKWKKGKLLGKGAYGKVWEGLLDSTRMIAVKEVELDVESQERAEAQFDKLQMEVGILRSLSHRNIVGYLGACMNNGVVYIFMDYISGGSIQNILKRFGPLSEKVICHYTRQILKALHYLHFNKIMHRDVKGANILVTPKGVVKLIDFGCAKQFVQQVESVVVHSVRGTPYWMAPEIIIGHDYGPKSDIWSLGATVHEMATTHPPWGKLLPEAAMFQIGIGRSFPMLPDEISSELKDLYQLCLAREPSQRPSADVLLEHSFFKLMRGKANTFVKKT